MEWLTEFQHSLRGPLIVILGEYWWVLALIAVCGFLSLVLGFEPQLHWSSGSNAEDFDDGGGDGDGGD